MPPKCSRKERRRGFSNRSSVDAGSHVRETLCVSMQKQKHFMWSSESRCNWESLVKICLQQNSTTQMFEFVQHFMDDHFVNLGEYKAGCAQRLFLKNKGQF